MGTVTVMEQQHLIGQRVRETINRAFPAGARTDASIAAEAGMKPDAFSRSVSGGRAFSSLELARLAHLLDADVHWLITGEPDPLSVRIAARHTWDPEAREHHLPTPPADDQVLDRLALAYRQAHPWRRDTVERLPADPIATRELLGEGFIHTFAERVEQVLGIDVVRIQGLSTDYSFTIAGRRVVLLKTEPGWFRPNWSLAHEVAHLALGHHDVTDQHDNAADERPANAFASELLLPEQQMRAIDWSALDEADLARHVWAYGVSTEALNNRLNTLGLYAPPILSARPEGSTMRLLRRQQRALPAIQRPGTPFMVVDPISYRYDSTTVRRIPDALVSAHFDGIAEGRLNKGTLAWLLETTPEAIEVDEPPAPEPMSDDELMAALGN